MTRIYIRKKTTKQVLSFLKEGKSLPKISKELSMSSNKLRSVIAELAKRRLVKTDDIADLRTYFIVKKFKSKIIEALKEGKDKHEIVNILGISSYYFDKIIPRISRGKNKAIPQRKIHNLTKKFGDRIIEDIKRGNSLTIISNKLGITITYIKKILTELKKRKRIKTDSVVALRSRLTERGRTNILIAKKLYDEVHTLEKVATKLKLTRERVRQLLELGDKAKLFIYKPYRKVQLEELISEITKEDIVKELVLAGSCKNIEINHNLRRFDINKLLNYYSIDSGYIKRVRRDKRDLKQYQSIVDFLGHHPTTTELSKEKEWRNLWHRVYHNWGGFDNFRREYGIPMPPKGYSKFKEKVLPIAIEVTRKKGRENRDKIKLEVLSLLEKRKGNKLAAHKIARLINKNEMTVRRCLLELSKENKIDVIKESKGTYYFLKDPVCV